MKIRTKFQRQSSSESGMTVVELMIAGFVLVFGMLSIMGLLMLAIGNNGRSKVDSSATMLNQAVIEQVSAKLAGGGPGSITDCNGTGAAHIIGDAVDDNLAAAGAQVLNGAINFNQAQAAILADYYMNYQQCDAAGNPQLTYDVRWNVTQMGTSNTYLVTVGARPSSGLPTRFSFALPVNMRAYVGYNPPPA